MHLGRFIARGTPAEVLEHPAVVDSYLGGTELARTPQRKQRRRAKVAT
ncbi:MAG: hypothetical protein ACRD1T_11895 [Acidimicrobiia bacterium]